MSTSKGESVIAKIKELGYTITEGGNNTSHAPDRKAYLPFLYINYKGKSTIVPHMDVPFTFTQGKHYDTIEEAVANGATTTTSREIYRDYYDLDEEELCWFDHKCDSRSWNYIKSEMDRIGLIKIKQGEELPSILPDDVVEKRYLGWGCPAYVGQVEDDWVVELTVRGGIDSFWSRVLWFTHSPSDDEIYDALACNKALMELSLRNSVLCWQDIDGYYVEGKHWLDCGGEGISNKVRLLNH